MPVEIPGAGRTTITEFRADAAGDVVADLLRFLLAAGSSMPGRHGAAAHGIAAAIWRRGAAAIDATIGLGRADTAPCASPGCDNDKGERACFA